MCIRQCESMLDPSGDVLDCPVCPFANIETRPVENVVIEKTVEVMVVEQI